MRAIVFTQMGGPEVLALGEAAGVIEAVDEGVIPLPDSYLESRQSTGKLVLLP